MYCHKCGIDIDDDAVFCKICGTPQNQVIKQKEKTIRTSIPSALLYELEHSEPKKLLERFEKALKTKVPRAEYKMLPDIWGILFSRLYISPVDLINSMNSREGKISEQDVQLLRLFIKLDCRKGGRFVEAVIQKGGMLDRAALIMIADPSDLARLERDGTTAIHQLITACDNLIRSELIRKIGKQLLSTLYDHTGTPALFLIYGMSGLRIHDLDAIGEVFSKDELKKVKVKSGMGRNGLEIFEEISRSINYLSILETTISKVTEEKRAGEKSDREETDAGSCVTPPLRKEDTVVSPDKVVPGNGPEPAKPKRPLLPAVTNVYDTSVTEQKEKPGNPLKILIVEDDEIVRQLLKIRLNMLGYNRLFEAGDGEQAVKLNQEIMSDVIFMDINMPGKIDGIDAAGKIKTDSASRVVFLSAYTDSQTIQRAKEISPDGFIAKPFSDTDLRVTLSLL
jgi:CheY-like chemotaxis protein